TWLQCCRRCEQIKRWHENPELSSAPQHRFGCAKCQDRGPRRPVGGDNEFEQILASLCCNSRGAPCRSELILLGEAPSYLEMRANLLILLNGFLIIFSKCVLKSLNNQADFDSAIRRFDPSRPSQLISLSNRALFPLFGFLPLPPPARSCRRAGR